MINIKELEKRWYKYKAKNLLLVLFLVFLLLALPYGLYYIFEYFSATSSTLLQQKETHQQKSEVYSQGSITSVEVNQSRDKVLTEKNDKKNSVTLSPTIPIVDLENEKLKDQTVQKRRYIAKKRRYKPVPKKKNLVKAKASAALTPQELTVLQGRDLPRQRKDINFKTSSSDYIRVMKQKFAKNKNPREALLLAKAYYQSAKYAKAQEWALRANSLDKNLDESWFVFAKAKAKMGKHNEALKILDSFYKSTKSPRAKELMTKIKTRSI